MHERRGAARQENALRDPAAIDRQSRDRRPQKSRSSRGDASGVCRASFSMSRASPNAVSGYAGGDRSLPRTTRSWAPGAPVTPSGQDHFRSARVTYGRLLQVFFSVVHDPTQLNRQGPDTGPQYRSAIFPANAEQAKLAKAYIAQLNQARVFDAAIVTTIEPDRPILCGRGDHQDFLTLHPTYPYIVHNDLPKSRNSSGCSRAVSFDAQNWSPRANAAMSLRLSGS